MLEGEKLKVAQARLAERFSVLTDRPRPGRMLFKWTGGKGRQAAAIASRFPDTIETYYEPFVGGGAVLYRLLTSGMRVGQIDCSDICRPLIDLWNLVKHAPRRLIDGYEQMWKGVRQGGRDYYWAVRQEFNLTGDPCRFFFLLRSCRNGLVRFNRRGEFNVGFHPYRQILEPEKVRPILEDWHRRLNEHRVRFIIRDYSTIQSEDDDLLYLDPPYATERTMYSGRFDYSRFFEWLGRQKGRWLLSQGMEVKQVRPVEVPEGLYEERVKIGNAGEPGEIDSDWLYIQG
jgi:DNA adenine methylase